MSCHVEWMEARNTYTLSKQTASQFVAPGSDTGKVLDQKYWFAKLYEIVTYNELGFSIHTRYPGFSLHFMKVFYGMYFDALANFLGQRSGAVSSLWITHFTGLASTTNVDPDSYKAIEYSVLTGAIAHIQGDMPVGLVKAYQTWRTNPKPAFKDLRDEFITKSRGAFSNARAQFYVEVNNRYLNKYMPRVFNNKFPEIGPYVIDEGQQELHIHPSLDEMFRWREDAWRKAAARI
jgi:hypothetical protein